jgi:hypothetical protein
MSRLIQNALARKLAFIKESHHPTNESSRWIQFKAEESVKIRWMNRFFPKNGIQRRFALRIKAPLLERRNSCRAFLITLTCRIRISFLHFPYPSFPKRLGCPKETNEFEARDEL